MNSIPLILSSVVLLVLLIVLVLYYVFRQKPSKPAKQTAQGTSRKAGVPSFEQLSGVLKSKGSSTAQLKEASEQLLQHYGTIEKKLGTRAHPNFERYREIIFALCRHPNVTKEIILAFDKGLVQKNSAYRREIDDVLKQGLSARGM